MSAAMHVIRVHYQEAIRLHDKLRTVEDAIDELSDSEPNACMTIKVSC